MTVESPNPSAPDPGARAPSRAKLVAVTLFLGLVHALVDAASAFLIYRDLNHASLPHAFVVTMVLAYNALAFAGQTPVGVVTDWLRSYRGSAVLGALLAVAALLLGSRWPVVAVVTVGVGNALFHVGAGAHVLRSSGDRAAESGLFVGPGAVGLFAGIWAASHFVDLRWVLVGLLSVFAPVMVWLVRAEGEALAATALPRIRAGGVWLAVASATLLLGSIAVRALVGGGVAGAWRGVSVGVMALLAVAACCGKMLGGIVGDRVGWTWSSVVALVLAAPLVSVFVLRPEAAILGMLLFQMTMPVTLKAVHHLIPRQPGIAFGVPCLALFLGSLPGLERIRLLDSWPEALATVLASAALIAVGLLLLARAGGSVGGQKTRSALTRAGGPPARTTPR